MSLNEIYERYKKEFNRTGWHPHPSKLLALRLLQIKDEMTKGGFNRDTFYRQYEEKINEMIEEVIVDFAITREMLIKEMCHFDEKFERFIRENKKEYESRKIDVVFRMGYDVVRWANTYFKDATPEEIYSIYSESLRSHYGFPYDGIDYTSFTTPNELIEFFINDREPKRADITISLEDIYNEYREEFIETGKRPDPSELLMIKMLQEKEKQDEDFISKFELSLEITSLIDVLIEDLRNDFEYTTEDMIEYIIEKTGCDSSEYFDFPDCYASAMSRYALNECIEFFCDFIRFDYYESVEEVYNSFIKSREETQTITSNKVRRRKPVKFVATTGFKFKV